MIFNRIEDKCREKKIAVSQMLGDLKIGTNTYYAAKRVQDLKVSTLQRIADYLETPLGWFVGDITGAEHLLNDPASYTADLYTMLARIDKTTTESYSILKHITGR